MIIQREKLLTNAPEWPEGTVIVDIPEPGDPDWTGVWEVWLGRSNTDKWVILQEFGTSDEALDFARLLMTVVYRGQGFLAVKHDPDGRTVKVLEEKTNG